MIRQLHGERGWTLIELLVAMTLMLIVLSATLTSFNAFSNNTKRNTDFNDQQDQIRTVMDQILRQVRNLANPTTGASGSSNTTVAYADSFRLVFQTTDPQKQWVSYCLNTSTAPSTVTNESIWYQTTANNALTPAAVAGSNMVGPACPSISNNWQTSQRVGTFVTNQVSPPPDRPLFSYYSYTGPALSTPVLLANTQTIVRVALSIFIKLDPNRPPAETELASAAYMRNQNLPPISSFTAKVSGTTYTLDGGGSSDPEQRTLVYDWYTVPASPTPTIPSPSALPSCGAVQPDFSGAPGWSCLGTSVQVQKSVGVSTLDVFLRVTDPGNLQTLSSFSGGSCLSSVDSLRVPTNCGAIP